MPRPCRDSASAWIRLQWWKGSSGTGNAIIYENMCFIWCLAAARDAAEQGQGWLHLLNGLGDAKTGRRPRAANPRRRSLSLLKTLRDSVIDCLFRRCRGTVGMPSYVADAVMINACLGLCGILCWLTVSVGFASCRARTRLP